MDLATTLSIVQTIQGTIQTLAEIKALWSISDCRRELADLESTVETVKAVLEDAESKQDALNSQEKNYIKELKDAVYDVDDVMDEFLTLAKRRKLVQGGDNLSNKVKSVISRFKLIMHNFPSKIKKVNRKLDGIATKSDKFSFKVENKPLKFTKEETSSFVCNEIIGREKDVETIVGMLLGSDNVDESDVSFLSIVGMGGLGKTALAQLVFNDPRVTRAFQLKNWTCVADQDQEQWNLTELLGKVLRELPIGNKNDLTSLEQMHHEVRRQLGGEKYLIVLDDVWTESYHKWQPFEEFLKVGQKGSWVVVTTRSKTTAQMVGVGRVHELLGLSEKESWCLFERMAFLPRQIDDDLVAIGKEIVKKCTDVPLAIRVVASLLRGRPKTNWLSFLDKGLANISESRDIVTHILKISYHQLQPALKTCFAYCAIFPKDWEISKKLLIRLWMAQGYISAECVGEEYFQMLLQRCFFQDIYEGKDGEIEMFKMHDLLHDIAEEVAGEEICRLNFDTLNVSKRVRHLSLLIISDSHEILNMTNTRTYLQVERYEWYNTLGSGDKLLSSNSIHNWMRLRSLDLRKFRAKSLPKSIGKLLHLRFLDLSDSKNLEFLPKSITELVNMQILDLSCCTSLRELPKSMSKLVNLSTLNLVNCDALSHMPSGIGMLTCLHTLDQFIVGMRETSSATQCFDRLKDLQPLDNLKGGLKIMIGVAKNAKYVTKDHGGGAYLRNKECLESIAIYFKQGDGFGSKQNEQTLLEEMQPHYNLRKLVLRGYHGETMPRWPRREDNSAFFDLPNLVTLKIYKCEELLCLPWQVGKLSHLRKLQLSSLKNMEYVVNANLESSGSSEGSSFFPSLKKLELENMPNLKGWWRRSGSKSHVVHVVGPDKCGSSEEQRLVWVPSPCFTQLRELSIDRCEKMRYVPVCPRLEYLKVYGAKIFLYWNNMMVRYEPGLGQSLSRSNSKLKQLTINNLEWLKSMPTEYFQSLAALAIQFEDKVESLTEIKELFQTCLLSSLRFVGINWCKKLNVVGWLEHLSALERLKIEHCPNLVLAGIPWQHLPGSLYCLYLLSCNELEELPEGMQYCTSLRSLRISVCPKLERLPKWMPKLTSLRKLQLRYCSDGLYERCKNPNGEDWPLIQHIPLTCILTEYDEQEAQVPEHHPWTIEDDWF